MKSLGKFLKKSACASLAALTMTAAAQSPSPNDPTLKHKILPALLKIEIIFRDPAKRQLGKSIVGQGIRISPDGYILTAAHVAIPTITAFNERNASTYEMRISSFSEGDSETKSGYIPLAISLPKDIRKVSIYDESINEDSITTCTTSSIQPCVYNDITAKSDFIIFRIEGHSNAFVDLVGPFDLESSFKEGNTGVVSDFDSSNHPQYLGIEPEGPAHKDSSDLIFKSGVNDIFNPGTSGSPVIVWRTAPQKGLVVAGLVSHQMKEDVIHNRFRAMLAGRTFSRIVLPGLRDDAAFLSAEGPPWNCSTPFSEIPGPNTILRDFISIARKNKNAGNRYLKTFSCTRSLLGWQSSFAILEDFFDLESQFLLNNLNANNQLACDVKGRCHLGLDESPTPYVRLAEALYNTRRERETEIENFRKLGGYYVYGDCPPGSSCLHAGEGHPEGPKIALAAKQRAEDLDSKVRMLEMKMEQSSADMAVAKLVLESGQTGTRADDLLFIYSLGNKESSVPRSLEQVFSAIKNGEEVLGLSESTKYLIKKSGELGDEHRN